MTVYAESSAVLSWLLGEATGRVAGLVLKEASSVFTSELTLLECDRTIHAATTRRRLTPEDAQETFARLDVVTAPWHLFRISSGIIDRARRAFPHEPVRSLDALHLATALRISEIRPDLRVLSFDRRIRSNAVAMGLDALPRKADHPGRYS